MDAISAGVPRRRRIIVVAGLVFLAAAASLSAQILNRGEIFQITAFRPVRLSGEQARAEFRGRELAQGLELFFRINASGDFSGILFQVTLFDAQMRPIRDGIEHLLFDSESRQATGLRSSYISSQQRRIDGFRGRRTYKFTFLPSTSFRYALAAVGNDEEMIYAVHPRGTRLEDLLPRK